MANSSNLVHHLFLSEKQQHHLIINTTTSSSSTVEAIQEHLHHNEDLPPEKEQVHHGALKPIKIIPEAKEKEEEEEEEGFKTPTSEQHRIPAMLECPPAPARNKNHKKRRTKHNSCSLFQSSVLRYSNQDIDSLFPALHHQHHLHGGNNNKNKKIKLS
ncbi:hypothetical protein PIB30_061254 [Stylosanthes scabra]|uniref:Uncharacterized protein n=1 Tax=Stylosanthes scabra TaxID=79078 RepID=A0ABU6ZJG8_9FABA|nr:hypothetical protein [Stylosanthes scabra]